MSGQGPTVGDLFLSFSSLALSGGCHRLTSAKFLFHASCLFTHDDKCSSFVC